MMILPSPLRCLRGVTGPDDKPIPDTCFVSSACQGFDSIPPARDEAATQYLNIKSAMVWTAHVGTADFVEKRHELEVLWTKHGQGFPER